MKIGFFLARFPELSQTFILHQVLGLLERGHEVEVLCASEGPGARLHDAVRVAEERYSLRRTFLSRPESLLARTAAVPWLIGATVARHPREVARALDVRRYGWFAATGTVLHAARPLLGAPRRYDAIVAHFGPEGIVANALRELSLLSGPLLTFFHGYDLTSAPRLAGRRMYGSLFRGGERFAAISDYGRRLLLGLGAPPERTVVQHMGVDVERFRPRSSLPRESKRCLRVLSIGRLVEKKGFSLGIEAVREGLGRGVSIDYRIIGDGPLLGSLRMLARERGVSSVVRLTGPAGQEEVLRALESSDVLIAPSVTSRDGDQEGIPMVLMEAMACGLPVVASRHGGIPELVEDERSGMVVPEGDSSGVAEALARLALDEGLRRTLGQAARGRVVSDFNLATQNARLEALLVELAQESRFERA